MLRKIRSEGYKDGWRRETLSDVIEHLLDPILDRISVTGVTGDGDYYNLGVVKYLTSKNLDFVIRASLTDKIKDFIMKEGLKALPDGEGVDYKAKVHLGQGKKSVELRLVIVKRGRRADPSCPPQIQGVNA